MNQARVFGYFHSHEAVAAQENLRVHQGVRRSRSDSPVWPIRKLGYYPATNLSRLGRLDV